jgi:DNA-binding response OmpR family regulator
MSRLLIIDDSIELLEVLKIFFEMKGYEVRILSDSSDLNSMVQISSPELFLIDVRLSYEDGREICKALKSSDGTRNIPVVLTSASPSILADHEKDFADDFIEKPFDVNQLEEKIKFLLPLSHTRSLLSTESASANCFLHTNN